MPEKVVVHQNKKFETMFMVWDPESPEGTVLTTVDRIYAFTPYGMLLASLGSCTAMVINTYAQHHKIQLDEVEITLEYDRTFDDDCENCENITDYTEVIGERIVLHGDLKDQDRDRLASVSRKCPIEKMLEKGVKINSQVTTVIEMREEEIKHE